MSEFSPQIVRAAIERFSYRFDLPEGWQRLPIPEEAPDFGNALQFMPIGAFMAPYAAIVFSVAVRPVYSGGAPPEWLKWLCEQQEIQVESLAAGEGRAVAVARQDSEAGPMRMRLVLFVHGDAMLTLTALAPEALWNSVDQTFDRMIDSFAMLEAAEQTLADFALASDAGTLDEDNARNRYFRENGIGLTPRVLNIDMPRKRATVGAGAIVAKLDIPLGWHIIDDGRRTLLFDPNNDIQINFNLIRAENGDLEPVADAIIQDVLAGSPGADARKLDMGGRRVIGVRGMQAGADVVDQAYLFESTPMAPDLFLKVRVTALPPEMTRAMDLAGLVIEDLRFG